MKKYVAVAVFIIVLSLAVAYLLPAIQSRQRAAELHQCKNNLEKIGLALQQYHDVHGSFPPVALYDAGGAALLSWRVLLLPYLGQEPLYHEFHLGEPWDSSHNLDLLARMPKTFRCPFDPDIAPNMTSYVAVAGKRTVFPPRGLVRREDIKDGPHLTIMLVEIGASTIPWSKPQEVVFNESFRGLADLASPRRRGARSVLFADGSVKCILDAVDPTVCRALMTVDGSEPIAATDF